jgi:hypothetical protein
MDKGIRPACNAKFRELLPQRAEMGNTAFRKAVMQFIMNEYNITLASAATHYNHAFKLVKEANPELVDGLGRPEDKKGGRKPKAKPEARDPLVFAPFETKDQHQARMQAETAALNAAAPEQTVFTVKKKSDGTVVAEGLSLEDAKALVEKAKAAKKAALFWI